jgi:hypothetical protein
MPSFLHHGRRFNNDISRIIELLWPGKSRGGHTGWNRPAAKACGERPTAEADPGQGGE